MALRAAGLILLCACSAPEPISEPELRGCMAWSGRSCLLTDRAELVVWSADADRLMTDGALRGPVTIQGGRRWTVSAPTSIRLAHGSRVREVPVQRTSDLLEGMLARAADDPEQVEAELRQLPAAWQGRAEGARARIAMRSGHTTDAAERWERAIASHADNGDRRAWSRDAGALAWLRREQGDLTGSAELLDAFPQLGDAEGAASAAYHRALLHEASGDLRGALRALQDADTRAERLDLRALQRHARVVRAPLLADLGRLDDALADLDRAVELLGVSDGPCEGADIQTNLGWTHLLVNGPQHLEAAGRAFAAASAARAAGCPRPFEQANGLTNEALAAVLAGHEAAARSLLDRARQAPGTPEIALWQLEVDARLQQLKGEDAAATWTALAEAAEALGAGAVQWRALVGRAQTSDGEPALAAWTEAEVLLEELARSVPLGEGRARFLGMRDTSLAGLVDALVRVGRVEDAWTAGRRARRRALDVSAALQSTSHWSDAQRARWQQAATSYREVQARIALEARADWTLPVDELLTTRKRRIRELATARHAALDLLGDAPSGALPAMDGRGLVLCWLPLPEGWLLVVRDDEGVTAHRLGRFDLGASPETLATALWGPAADRLRSATSVSLMPWGPLEALPLHRLPLDGAALHSRMPVRWLLDVTARPHGSGDALVVADPTGELPHAAEEGRLVAERLGAQPLMGDAATVAAVRAALPESGLAHFATHGEYAGWQSELRLADGELTVADLLALPAVPERVVLSTCEGGRTAEVTVQSIGLAQAFVLAGSTQVLAAIRPVDDDDARAVATAVHARGGDLATALAAALTTLEGGGVDLDVWRVLEP